MNPPMQLRTKVSSHCGVSFTAVLHSRYAPVQCLASRFTRIKNVSNPCKYADQRVQSRSTIIMQSTMIATHLAPAITHTACTHSSLGSYIQSVVQTSYPKNGMSCNGPKPFSLKGTPKAAAISSARCHCRARSAFVAARINASSMYPVSVKIINDDVIHFSYNNW